MDDQDAHPDGDQDDTSHELRALSKDASQASAEQHAHQREKECHQGNQKGRTQDGQLQTGHAESDRQGEYHYGDY